MIDPEDAPYHIWICEDPENIPPINKPTHREMVPREVYEVQQMMLRETAASRRCWIKMCDTRNEIIKRHEATYAGLLELQELTCTHSDEFAAEAKQLKKDIEEEWRGTLAVMEKFGARSDETITMFVTRLVSDRDFWAKTAKEYKDDYNEVIRRGPKDE